MESYRKAYNITQQRKHYKKGIRTLYCYVYDVAVVVVLYRGWLSVHIGKVPHTGVSYTVKYSKTYTHTCSLCNAFTQYVLTYNTCFFCMC